MTQRLCVGASDDTAGGVVSSDAALAGLGVASNLVASILPPTRGLFNPPEWAVMGPARLLESSMYLPSCEQNGID